LISKYTKIRKKLLAEIANRLTVRIREEGKEEEGSKIKASSSDNK
jgi:hypothetical protein